MNPGGAPARLSPAVDRKILPAHPFDPPAPQLTAACRCSLICWIALPAGSRSWKVRQVVLYVGQAKMKMQDRWDLGDAKVAYRLIDIREFDAEELLRSERPGDLALAMLARGGTEKLKEITRRAADLSGPARIRALTQMILLSGLRGLSDD